MSVKPQTAALENDRGPTRKGGSTSVRRVVCRWGTDYGQEGRLDHWEEVLSFFSAYLFNGYALLDRPQYPPFREQSSFSLSSLFTSLFHLCLEASRGNKHTHIGEVKEDESSQQFSCPKRKQTVHRAMAHALEAKCGDAKCGKSSERRAKGKGLPCVKIHF